MLPQGYRFAAMVYLGNVPIMCAAVSQCLGYRERISCTRYVRRIIIDRTYYR